jgi:hypothetical protein
MLCSVGSVSADSQSQNVMRPNQREDVSRFAMVTGLFGPRIARLLGDKSRALVS